ncbi:MAG: hypothetical protein F6K22_22735 [Okeania sp. SIO2F4]|uniref:hypothetical protein n=1 Tax=Okeania sp. SIO2F4 TaxID=2607790 RepID=UPI0014298DB0|nr:hypothetical protein [Okeania sp. SIO2F4]NES05386.1 hypothetical protein [Okeania sp. SIO2F4]
MISIIGLVNLGIFQMDDDNLEIPPIYMQRKNSSISLDVNREAFKDFVVSLLGKPESVEGYVEGAFEINFGGFEQLNQIIDNRITKQNQSVLVEFRAKLFFNDNSSFSFSGVKSFQEYENKERRNLICTGFIFTWIYLVEFHDKKVPERQEISVFSVEEGTPYSAKSKSTKMKSTALTIYIGVADKIPQISYSIRCTNQGWGIEIAELVRNCIIGFVKTDVRFAGFRRKIMKDSIVVLIPSLILSFVLCRVVLWILSKEILTSCSSFSDQIGQFLGENILLAEKVDFLIKFFDTCAVKGLNEDISIFFFAFFYIFTSLLLTILMLWLTKLPTYRFLLFTEASKKEQDEYFSKNSSRKNFWLMTVLVGSILAFLNRILWNYISEWWINIFG